MFLSTNVCSQRILSVFGTVYGPDFDLIEKYIALIFANNEGNDVSGIGFDRVYNAAYHLSNWRFDELCTGVEAAISACMENYDGEYAVFCWRKARICDLLLYPLNTHPQWNLTGFMENAWQLAPGRPGFDNARASYYQYYQ